MSTKARKVIVQGITGAEGMKHTLRMLECGTEIVGGVNPRKAGEIIKFNANINGVISAREIKVYATVSEAMGATNANTSVVFVPPAFAKGAVIEAVDAGIELVVVITEGIPQQDSVYFNAYADRKFQQTGIKTQILGPNCPGAVFFNSINPAISDNLGIIPDKLTIGFGPLGLVSKSGTLTYQMMSALGHIGFKTCIGIGGDANAGTSFIDALELMREDNDIELIVMIGEIGGDLEERTAQYIVDSNYPKPIIAYIAGVSAPEGKTMGHAGAIISKSSGSANAKIEALNEAGIEVGRTPEMVAEMVANILNNSNR